MNLDHPMRAVRAPLATPATNARANTHGLLPARPDGRASTTRRESNQGCPSGRSGRGGRSVVPDVDDALPVSLLLLPPDRYGFPFDRALFAVGTGESDSIRTGPVSEVPALRHDDVLRFPGDAEARCLEAL